MTKFILKTSVFLTVLTLIYCTLTGVPLKENIVRCLAVFVGSYAIIIAGLVAFKIILMMEMGKGVDGE